MTCLADDAVVGENRQALRGRVRSPQVELLVFLTVAAFLLHVVSVDTESKPLDPSNVIPKRVEEALNIMSEGVLLLDAGERIAVANNSFAQTVGLTAAQLRGREVSALPWGRPEGEDGTQSYPWTQTLQSGQKRHGVPLLLKLPSSEIRRFIVNVSPMLGEDLSPQGALVTFSDISEVQERNIQLRSALDELTKAQEEVSRQNAELQVLASRDPLTGCLNRRAFFENAQIAWGAAMRYKYPLGFVMVDIDHFKWVNDRHGHAAGDGVLKKVASILHTRARESDVVCRYGGEEFCVLLLHADTNSAAAAAEKFRRSIEFQREGIPVTVSLGVSSTALAAPDLERVLDEADQALYAAKEAGRNCVVRWDELTGEETARPSASASDDEAEQDEGSNIHIPIQAVTALMAVLEYRDIGVAEHCRQVAELCVRTAEPLMPPSECFVLEVAALLHDIGKLGVPDSVLLKPGPLTDEEWGIIHRHNAIGAEIIASAFDCPELSDIVRSYHAWHGPHQNEPGLPSGDRIPLRARILMIADAFSSMVTEQPYREALTPQEAFNELRRGSGTQFDRELVEKFIERISSGDQSWSKNGGLARESVITVAKVAESIASAFKARDTYTLGTLAGRLSAVATKQDMPEIAALAEKLHKATRGREDLKSIMQMTTGLLELCSEMQATQLAQLPKPAGES